MSSGHLSACTGEVYYIKKTDAVNQSSMGTNLGSGASFATPPELLHHLNGIIIALDAVIGANSYICQRVTITYGGSKGGAKIGDNCLLGAGTVHRGGYKHLKEVLKRQQKRIEVGVPIDCKLLISVGELSVRKNRRVVVEVLQGLPDKYWYAIVGKGDLKDELERMDTTDRLILLGYRTDIVELLQSSDLFVFPSL